MLHHADYKHDAHDDMYGMHVPLHGVSQFRQDIQVSLYTAWALIEPLCVSSAAAASHDYLSGMLFDLCVNYSYHTHCIN